MAGTSISALIDEACHRLGWSTSDSGKRLRLLAAFQAAERAIGGMGSQMYLSRKWSLTLSSAASSVALPTSPDVNYDKDMSLRIVGEIGYLSYVPHDRFLTQAASTAYALRNDRPAVWSVIRDASGTLQIYVDPANTTGGNLTLELVAQQAVADLVDTTSSFSLLPVGREWDVLLPRAEGEIRRELDKPGWQQFMADAKAAVDSFLDGQRSTKEFAKTDQDAAARQISDNQVQPDAGP